MIPGALFKAAEWSRFLPSVLLLTIAGSCQSATQFSVYAESAISSSLVVAREGGDLLTLAVSRPAILYLREIVIQGRSGETILELGDDTGLKDQLFMFIVPGQPAVIAASDGYHALLKNHFVSDETTANSHGHCAVRNIILNYCLVWAPQWPLEKRAQLSRENLVVYQAVGPYSPSMEERLVAVPVRQ
jgi:hypothetical protein